jgi:YHS domain-containing protein
VGVDMIRWPSRDGTKSILGREAKILGFLDTYLRLETIEQYQADNYVIDPVCKMRINRLFATAHAECGGKTYYFCIPECKEKFAASPEKYVG